MTEMRFAKFVELELPCTLTERELASRSLMLVETVAEKDDVRSAKAAEMKKYTDKLTALDERQRQLAHMIRTGIERRMVNCVVQFHVPAEATKRTIRVDTGEVVKEEAMSALECQLHMFDSQVEFQKFMEAQGPLPDESKPDPPTDETPEPSEDPG